MLLILGGAYLFHTFKEWTTFQRELLRTMYRCGWGYNNNKILADFGESMYQGMIESNDITDIVDIIVRLGYDYPGCIIQWKLAVYMEALNKESTLYNELYKAAKKAFIEHKDNIPIFVNSLIMDCQRIVMDHSGNIIKAIKNYEDDLNKFMQLDVPDSIKKYFSGMTEKMKIFRMAVISDRRKKQQSLEELKSIKGIIPNEATKKV